MAGSDVMDAMKRELLTADTEAKEMLRRMTDRVTERAVIYMRAGLSMADVMEALKISRATLYRRMAALEERKEAGGATTALSSTDSEQ